MKVTFHGVRGSIPTPGGSTVRYGGNTVSVEVRLADGTLLVLDAGTGLRPLGNQLLREGWRAPVHLLVTHVHWDHIMGAPFFTPIWRKDTHVVCHAFTQAMHDRFRRNLLFDGEHFPIRAADIPAQVEVAPLPTGDRMRVGSAEITRVSLNHPGGADGYRVEDADGSSVLYLTDNELAPPGPVTTTASELARFSQGAGLLIHDAQYLPSDMPLKHGWGHSLVDHVLDLGRMAEARTLALFHHDPDRDDAALDQIGVHAASWAATRAPAMRTVVAAEGQTIDVEPR